jgi:hypothetical protein
MARLKQVYKITYPNGKIYVGMDLTGAISYFGSPSAKERIATDLAEHRLDLTVRKEILWESETATDAEVRAMERRFIRETGANNPAIGYNLTPRWSVMEDDGDLFSRFAPLLRDMTEAELAAEIERPQRLLLDDAMASRKHIEIAYFPVGHVNVDARVVIVGLTPGRQQMRNALIEARRCLLAGCNEVDTLAAVKVFASFSGPMRANLVAMLDSIGINRLLGLQSTASLWERDARLADFTSVLRFPVFVDGENFSGMPSMFSTPLLREQLMTGFAAQAATLRQAIFVPLGPTVCRAVEFTAKEVGLDDKRVLAGLPHPSGANGERIAFFLGRKPRGIVIKGRTRKADRGSH